MTNPPYKDAVRRLAQAMYDVDRGQDRLNPDESLEDYIPPAEYLLRAVLPDIEKAGTVVLALHRVKAEWLLEQAEHGGDVDYWSSLAADLRDELPESQEER